VAPDGALRLGGLRDVPGLFVASGCNVGGLSTSPAVGEAQAELIATGRWRYDLSSFSPNRCRPAYGDAVRRKAACRIVYEFQ
jgi:glycine/D-amino acid oxidase-like deaminating enzyme